MPNWIIIHILLHKRKVTKNEDSKKKLNERRLWLEGILEFQIKKSRRSTKKYLRNPGNSEPNTQKNLRIKCDMNKPSRRKSYKMKNPQELPVQD
jgi:hypothetical protein